MLKIQHFLSKGKEKIGGARYHQKNAAYQAHKIGFGGEEVRGILSKIRYPLNFLINYLRSVH